MHSDNKNREIGTDRLRAHADELFGSLTKSIDDIKAQIESISKTIDDWQSRLNTSTSKTGEQ